MTHNPIKTLRPLLFILLAAFSFEHARAQSTAPHKFTVVIDAGHGGKDAGAIGAYSKEKNINLNVVLELGRLIEQNCPDVKIIYTRKTDVFIELNERASIANRAKADLFISVHTNALPAGRIAYGSETYTLGMARSAENLEVAKRENSVILVENNYRQTYEGFNPGSAESYIIFEFMQDEHMKQSVSLAKSIQKYYVSHAGRQNKGVHQAGFLVLRKTSMPAVLTELGFISTPAEEAFLNSKEGIAKLARSIFEGFLDYKQTQDGKARINIPYRTLNDEGMPVEPEKEKAGTGGPQAPESQAAAPSAGDQTAGSGKERGAVNEKESAVPEKSTPTTEKGSTSPYKKGASSESPALTATDTGSIVFKIQIISSNQQLHPGDSHFKGETAVSMYKENNLFKYTLGETGRYEEITARLRQVKSKFPDAFVVAFKNGEKQNLSEAIRSAKAKNKTR